MLLEHPTITHGVLLILAPTVPRVENHSTKWLPSLPSIERYGPQHAWRGTERCINPHTAAAVHNPSRAAYKYDKPTSRTL